MRAATYSRKSVLKKADRASKRHETDLSASVQAQNENARAHILEQGWSLDESHIYQDDGRSG
ncbi:MAG: hypothetical protein OEQ39_25815, partial [Gammaproteobacteria bacterium]|nr:hypothetical protein [Gammaproteobacteria bacterium]